LVFFTVGGEQFDYGAQASLTPLNARAASLSGYQTVHVRPVVAGTELYFVAAVAGGARLMERHFDQASTAYITNDVTAHVPTLLSASLRSMAIDNNTRILMVVNSGEAASTMQVYRAFWNGMQKEQSAWTQYVYDPSYAIKDVAMIKDKCYLLTKTANIWFIERQPFLEEAEFIHYSDISTTQGSFTSLYNVHLDRKFYSASGASADTGLGDNLGGVKWNLGVQTPASTVNRVVKLSTGAEYVLDQWGVTAKTTMGATDVGISKAALAAAGIADTALIGVPVVLGCSYTMSVTLSRPYAGLRRSYALFNEQHLDLMADPVLDRLTLVTRNTGDLTVTQTPAGTGTTAMSRSITAPVGTLVNQDFDFDAQGKSKDLVVTVTNAAARPCNVAAIQWQMHHAIGVR
jgi:hypothetical protein